MNLIENLKKPVTKRTYQRRVKKWVDALRSGNFKQVQERLVAKKYNSNELTYCCLGVACVIANVPLDEKKLTFLEQSIMLPKAVMNYYGLKTNVGTIDKYSTLAFLNDQGCNFDHIADVIQDFKKSLFTWA